MLIGALIAHYPHAAHGGQQHGACLPNLVVEAHFNLSIVHVGRHSGSQDAACLFACQACSVLTQIADEDVVSLLNDLYFLACYVAEYANSQSRSGEWMAGY